MVLLDLVKIPIAASLGVVLSLVVGAIALSLWKTRGQAPTLPSLPAISPPPAVDAPRS